MAKKEEAKVEEKAAESQAPEAPPAAEAEQQGEQKPKVEEKPEAKAEKPKVKALSKDHRKEVRVIEQKDEKGKVVKSDVVLFFFLESAQSVNGKKFSRGENQILLSSKKEEAKEQHDFVDSLIARDRKAVKQNLA